MILLAALMIGSAAVPATGTEQFVQAEAIRRTQPFRARTLYERAAKLGHPRAQASLGMMLFSDGNRIAALRWLKAASDQHEPRGMLLWGTALFNGDGVASNRVLGYSLVARAARTLPEAEGTRSEMDLVMSAAERTAAVKLLSPAAAPAQVPDTAAVPSGSGRPMTTRLAKRTSPAPLAQPSSSGVWRIQLGAFRLNGSAQRLFAQLSPQLPGKQPSFLPLGSMTRLLVGPYSGEAAALSACRALGAQQPCFAVAPH